MGAMSERRHKAHPQSAPGDFYVVNDECASCGLPHVLAPDLVGWADVGTSHCFWKRQPETPEELRQAIDVIRNSEVGCHRYAGDDPAVISQVGWEYSDSPRRPMTRKVIGALRRVFRP
jgi:hypothetical protein